MGMRINNNMEAMQASRQIAVNGTKPANSQPVKNAVAEKNQGASFSAAAVNHNQVANRLEQNGGVSAANKQAGESRIRNVEMAREVAATTRDQILNQSSTAMQTQANQVPQNVQDLLR